MVKPENLNSLLNWNLKKNFKLQTGRAGLTIFALLIMFLLCGCQNLQIKSIRDYGASATVTAQLTSSIKIENGAFSPSRAQMSAGQEITIINLDSTSHQVACDPHPTHDSLSDCVSPILYHGDQFSYKIKNEGEYGFHLEDNPSVTEKIVVK